MARQLNGSRIVFIAAALFLLYGAYLIVEPFATPLIIGALLAYTVYPLHKHLQKRLHNENATAFIVSSFVVLMLLVPLVFSANSLVREGNELYNQAKEKVLTGVLINLQCPESSDGITCWLIQNANDVLQNPQVMASIAEGLRTVLKNFTAYIASFVLSLPNLLVSAVIALLAMFFALRDGPALLDRLRRISPLDKRHQDTISNQFNDVIYGVLHGALLTSLIQGILGALGFWIFGISHPIFWGIVLGIFGFLPLIGTSFVWLPAAALQISAGSSTGDQALVWNGVGIIIYSLLTIQPVDWILKPYLASRHAKVNTLLVALGVLGGIVVFGPIGFIIGPLVLALLKTFIDIYEHELKPHTHLRGKKR